MSKITVTLNKSLKLYDDTSTCVVVCLSVISTDGVPAELFVNRYDPYKASYKFQHTAYYDELDSVADSIANVKTYCNIRTTSAEYKAATVEDAEQWVAEVCADVRRLLTQIKFFSEDSTSDTDVIVITQDSVCTSAEHITDVDSVTMDGVEIEF